MPATLTTTAPEPKGRVRVLLPAVFAAGGLMIVAMLGTVLAITGGSFSCVGSGDGPAGPTPTKTAVQAIPAARLKLYELAGRRFDIDWSFLASIGAQECGNGECAGNNGSGCAGPMQIAYIPDTPCSPGPGPTLWDRYKVSAFGGTPNINNPADAVFTAARILRQDMGAPPTGGSYQGYFEAACRYYGACANAAADYATEVMARAIQYGFNGAGAPAPTNPVGARPAPDPPGNGSGCEAGSIALTGVGVQRIVQVAETQLGYTEHPAGSSCTKYGPCEEWCSLFVAWVWEHAGIPLPDGTTPYAYSGSLYTWVRTHGGQILPPTATPAPGDAVLYGTGPGDSVHVGIVAQVQADGLITTIEGNYDNRVTRVGPFPPAQAAPGWETAPVYGYAQPPLPSTIGAGA
jgi:hypothetical protein